MPTHSLPANYPTSGSASTNSQPNSSPGSCNHSFQLVTCSSFALPLSSLLLSISGEVPHHARTPQHLPPRPVPHSATPPRTPLDLRLQPHPRIPLLHPFQPPDLHAPEPLSRSPASLQRL